MSLSSGVDSGDGGEGRPDSDVAADQFIRAWSEFIEISRAVILGSRDRSGLLRVYHDLEKDMSLAVEFSTSKRVQEWLRPRLVQHQKRFPTVGPAEMRWLTHEMVAFNDRYKNLGFAETGSSEADSEQEDSAEQGDIIKGSVEDFLVRVASTGLSLAAKLTRLIPMVGKKDRETLEGLQAPTKLLNELFKIVARSS